MILRTKKLQLGGAMTEYVPVDITSADRSGILIPTQGGSGSSSGGRRSSSASSPLAQLDKVKALNSDREALRSEIVATKEAITTGMSDPEFTTSAEYQALAKRLQHLTTSGVAQLEANKLNFDAINKELKDKTGIAMQNGKVFVKDNADGSYKVMDASNAVSETVEVQGGKVPRYVPQTVAQALNLRAQDSNFSRSNGGEDLENLVRGMYDAATIEKNIDNAFKSTGYGKDQSTSIILDDGSSVSVQDLFDHSSGNKVSTTNQSNQSNLNAARAKFTQSVPVQMISAMRDQAWQQYYQEFKGKPNLDDPDAWINKRVNDRINNSMLKYLKTSYKDDIKSGPNDDSEDDKLDMEKVSIHVNPVNDAYMTPKTTGAVENNKLLSKLEKNGKSYSGIMNVGASPISSIQEAYNSQFPAEEENRAISNNYFLNKLVGGEANWTLPDGTPVKSLQNGADYMVKPKNAGVTILHKVPVVKDPNTGSYAIAWEIMDKYSTYAQKVQDEENKYRQQMKESGQYSDSDIDKAIADNYSKLVRKVATDMGVDPNAQIETKQMASMQVLLPREDVEDEHKNVVSLSAVTPADEKYYEEQHGDDAPGWFSYGEDLAKTVIFAPIDGASVMASDFGMKERSMKMGTYYRQAKTIQEQNSAMINLDELLQNMKILRRDE